jgi:hypothetical protein
MTYDDRQKFRISPDVIVQHVAGETVLMDLRSEAYFGLNATGTYIWQMLDQACDFGAVVAALVAEFEGSERALRGDCARLLEELAEAGLVAPERAGNG